MYGKKMVMQIHYLVSPLHFGQHSQLVSSQIRFTFHSSNTWKEVGFQMNFNGLRMTESNYEKLVTTHQACCDKTNKTLFIAIYSNSLNISWIYLDRPNSFAKVISVEVLGNKQGYLTLSTQPNLLADKSRVLCISHRSKRVL